MNSADKGFFLAYTGDPLSKTAHSGHGMEQKSSFEIPGLSAAKKKAEDAAKKAKDAAKKAKELWELSQSDGGDSSQEEQTTPEKKTSLKGRVDAAKNAIQKGFGIQTRGLVGGVAGAATGIGLSTLYGKISDKPNIRRDLLMTVLGGAAGVGAGMQWPQISKWYKGRGSNDKKAAVTMDDSRELIRQNEAIKEQIDQLRRVQEAHKRLALAASATPAASAPAGTATDSSPEVNKTPGSSIWDKIDAATSRIQDKIEAAKNEISGQIKRPDPLGIHRDQWGAGLVGGAAGAATGGGLSAIYGKLSDNPSIRRDLLMTVLGGAAGVGAGLQAHRIPWKKSTKV